VANVGERYVDCDHRRPRRVVEIDSVTTAGYMLRTLQHPVKPGAVGRIYPITHATFDRYYVRL
jgi:hypothetical protein